MALEPGESCTYGRDPFGEADIVFSVHQDGRSCRTRIELKLCVIADIEQDDFFGTNFAANKNPDGTWTIASVPWLFNIRRVLKGIDGSDIVVNDVGLRHFSLKSP